MKAKSGVRRTRWFDEAFASYFEADGYPFDSGDHNL